MLWKGLRCTFVVLLAVKLDGGHVSWVWVLLPLILW